MGIPARLPQKPPVIFFEWHLLLRRLAGAMAMRSPRAKRKSCLGQKDYEQKDFEIIFQP
jgi:hypothetical protein